MNCQSLTKRAIPKAKILIAEDNCAQARIIADVLQMGGHEVILSNDGMSVLHDVEVHNPDVILIDRLMPGLDGIKICKRIKGNRDTSGIPIIMLTDRITVDDKIESLSAGADDLIANPFDDQELNALICARLRTKSEWDALKQKTQRLEKMLTRVESLAHFDPLTGLCNRRRCEEVLAMEFKKALRYDIPLSCLVLDIDHFKQVNDEHGHQAGDAVLREMAQIIRSNLREVDLAARWGGEEFVVLNPSTGKGNAEFVGEKIRKAVAEGTFTSINGPVTISIGVAAVPHSHIKNPDELVNAADHALYDAKKTGRNRVCAAV